MQGINIRRVELDLISKRVLPVRCRSRLHLLMVFKRRGFGVLPNYSALVKCGTLGSSMMLSRGLEWLCEPPQSSFTLSALLRRGCPGFADLKPAIAPKKITRSTSRAARPSSSCFGNKTS